MFNTRSQDLKSKFYDTGQFICFKVQNFFIKKNIDKNYIGLEIPRDRSIDIDDKNDWNLLKSYLRPLKTLNYIESKILINFYYCSLCRRNIIIK